MKRIVLNLVLVVTVIGLAAANIYAFIRPTHTVPGLTLNDKDKKPRPQPPNRVVKYNLSGLRDGFLQPKPPVPPSTSTLLGVVLHGNRRFAIVRQKGKNADVLEEGSELDAMRIKRIAPKGLILESNKGAKKFKVFPEDQ